MGEAEEVIRARLAASSAAAEEAERARQEELARKVEGVRAAVPALLTALKAKDYRDGQLIRVTTASGRRFFSGQMWTEQEEKAAWKLWRHHTVESQSTLWITVDGRFVWDPPVGIHLLYVTLEWLAETPSMLAETAAALDQRLAEHR